MKNSPAKNPSTKSLGANSPASKAIKIATWNINSVRLRIDIVKRFVSEANVDVLCLQETKVENDLFPFDAFKEMGLPHVEIHGQKGWHGVATASRYPLERLTGPEHCMHAHPRVLAVSVAGIEIHNLYVPAGGDIPNPDENPKFLHKLDFLDRMGDYYEHRAKDKKALPLVLVGDLNVAPLETDVWSHKQLLKVVSHTPPETTRMNSIIKRGKFTDVVRSVIPEPEQIFTWWSYRSPDWQKNNRGRRLDHIWATGAAAEAAMRRGRDGIGVHVDCRSWDVPSDHVPVTAVLAL